MDINQLLDSFLGALVGALVTGGAQIWSFRQGTKSARGGLSLDAARQLLDVVHQSKGVVRLLPHTESVPGSPLSYGERFSSAEPMRELLGHAQFAIMPLLTDPELVRRFSRFAGFCTRVSSPEVNAQDIYHAVNEVIRYGDHVGECLSAHINNAPLPAEAQPNIPDRD